MRFTFSAILAGGALTAMAAAVQAQEAMIKVMDQKAEGSTIVVESVTAPADGFLVVHAVQDGKPVTPGSHGYAAVKAGENKDVRIELDAAPMAGAEYVVMLHEDTGEKGKYEFAEGMTDVDKPVTQDGKPVMMTFKAG